MIQMQKNLSSLEEGKKEFIVDCKIRNLSQATIKYYDESFDYFINYINENYQEINVRKDITKSTINNYIIDM